MNNIDFLLEELTVVEPLGLDSVSDDFMQVVQLVDQEDYAAAAKHIKKQFEANKYDIRMIGYYLYNVFCEDGPTSLQSIARVFMSCLNENNGAIGPAKRKEKYFNSTLAWLANSLNDQLSYHKSTKGPQWSKWMTSFSVEVVQETSKVLAELMNGLPQAEYNTSADALNKLLAFVRELDRELSVIPHPASVPPESAEPDTKLEYPEPAESALPQVSHRGTMLPGTVELEVSVRFMNLCDKLSAFEQVLEKSDFKKAAMISNDILAELEDFDPREHFPKLFSNFYSSLTENVTMITPHWDQRDTLEWKMREQLYKVDLPSFIKS